MIPGRPAYWEIKEVWVFYVLAALATGLLLIGVAAHLRVWLKSAPGSRPAFSGPALRQALLHTFLGRTLFKGDRPAGFMHLLMFWGFFILLIGTTLL
ncbi:MAG: hypothetical protein EHM75_12310, partial [Desulfobacteraceae bacterium]